MRARRSLWVLTFVCATAFLLGPSLAALPTPDIAAIVDRVVATNTTDQIDCYGDYLARLGTREGDRRGYTRERLSAARLPPAWL